MQLCEWKVIAIETTFESKFDNEVLYCLGLVRQVLDALPRLLDPLDMKKVNLYVVIILRSSPELPLRNSG